MNDLEQTNMLQPLVDEIETAVSNAKKEIAEKVNSVITETYWKIGKYIVEFEQDGNVKAAYGSKLLTTLSHQLTLRLGRGYSRPNLNNIPSEDNSEETWHTPRLTLEEWEELYGGE